MAVPFRKVSKTRKNMRRTHYKIAAKGLVKCSNCGEMIRPHRACPKCGFYKGEQVVSEQTFVMVFFFLKYFFKIDRQGIR